MSQNPREFLYVVQESALNTPVAVPVVQLNSSTMGANSLYIRLIDGNSFTAYAKPVIEEIAYGGGFATTSEAVSDHYEAVGTLKTKLYPWQASMLLGLALTRINSGQTAPWTTTEPGGDLASASFYHATRVSDGSYKCNLFSGGKVTSVKIEVSRGSTTAMLTLGLVFSKSWGNSMDGTTDPTIGSWTAPSGTTAGAFPAPTEAQYPLSPYTFKQTAAGLVIATSGSTARTEYEDLSVSVDNAVDARWFEQSYRQIVQFLGRKSGLETTLYYKPTPDDISHFEGIAVHAASLVFTTGVSGTNLTLQFNGQNTILDLPRDLPLDKAYMTKLSLRNRWDPAATAGYNQDLTFSLA
jgi:hypothetical protein